MYGWGYAINHCISLFKKEQEERSFKIYVTDCLRLLTENTANMAMGKGQFLNLRWYDLIEQKPKQQYDVEQARENLLAKFR